MMPETQPAKTIPFKEIKYNIRIEALHTDEKLDLLANFFLKLEHLHLRENHRKPQLPPEAKIMFLTGGPKRDVTEARDFDGNLIHTRHLEHPRPMFAEIPEALSAISHWFDQKEHGVESPSPVHPISEVADVVYNITHLLTLDPNFYDNYNVYLQRIAASMGFSLDQLLTVTLYKYNFRLGQGKSQKDILLENTIIESLLTQQTPDGRSVIPTPTETQFQHTYHTLAEVEYLLNTRLNQLRQAHAWQKENSSPI